MAEKAIEEMDEQQRTCFIQANNLSREVEELTDKMRDASLRKASLQGELDDQMELLRAAEESLARADAQYSLLRDGLAEARAIREEAKSKLGDLLRERDRLLDATRRGGLEKEELSLGIKEALDALAGADQEAEQLKAELAALNGKAMGMERDRDDLESLTPAPAPGDLRGGERDAAAAGRVRPHRRTHEGRRGQSRLQPGGGGH